MGKPGRPRKGMRTRSNSKSRTRTTRASTSWTKKGLRTERIVKSRLGKNKLLKKNTESDISLQFVHIERNDFVHRGHEQQREDDVPVCACKYEDADLETACGDRCLNFLTSNECTPGYCPCGESCRNQRFQRKEYIKSKLVKTDERGWGLLADQDVKAGEFVIEYCGEVISCEEARVRSQAYEAEGLKDAYIISLSGSEFIDATRKGSWARFVNHSCEPNCETRKWTVLGEVRVGIFAKQEIKAGTELTYNYYFEWYGGTKVRCRCGAASCLGFLGAKSRGFQDDAYVWEDNDERYSVENIPLYDSEEDEPLSIFLKRAQVCKKLKKAGAKSTVVMSNSLLSLPEVAEDTLLNGSEASVVPPTADRNEDIEKPTVSLSPKFDLQQEGDVGNNAVIDGYSDVKLSSTSEKLECAVDAIGVTRTLEGPFVESEVKDGQDQKVHDVMAGEKRSVKGHLTFPRKRPRLLSAQQSRNLVNKRINARSISRYLLSKTACEEVSSAEEAEATATAELERLHEELRPTVEEHGKDGQDALPITLTERWIAASCKQLQAVFDFHFSIVKQLSCVAPVLCGTEVSSQPEN